MVEFLKEIIGFLFSDSGEIPEGQFFSLLIFSVSAALLGVTVVVFDFLASFVNIKSFLKLTHKPTMLPLFILVWGLGAGFATHARKERSETVVIFLAPFFEWMVVAPSAL